MLSPSTDGVQPASTKHVLTDVSTELYSFSINLVRNLKWEFKGRSKNADPSASGVNCNVCPYPCLHQVPCKGTQYKALPRLLRRHRPRPCLTMARASIKGPVRQDSSLRCCQFPPPAPIKAKTRRFERIYRDSGELEEKSCSCTKGRRMDLIFIETRCSYTRKSYSVL
ncbi:hypothetical protein MLD38_022106 [Melastoma candidum]|uniref:Uncharacterized protein n=1 Tax=Melastoma candidum TaxID=119954 RepID=A0ACB9QJ64_9MYRT|nr:hypothetical protein MLD38_022106 [Melastoma candidum]